MAWRRPGDRPLSETMLALGLNELNLDYIPYTDKEFVTTYPTQTHRP